MRIIPYNDKYNDKINNFIHEILVNEFEFKHHEEEILLENNRRFVDNGGNLWIAIDENENIIGTICLEKEEESVGQLKKLYVHKDYRSKGLAHDLYNELIEFAREIGILKIKLGTYAKLQAAVKFYIKKGFEMVQRKPEEDDKIYFILNEI